MSNGQDDNHVCDADEAVHLMAEFAESANPAIELRRAAADSLIAQLVELHGVAGWSVVWDPTRECLAIGISGFGSAIVAVGPNGEVMVGNKSQELEPVPLRLDRVQNMYVGESHDSFRTPAPGVPVARRAAAAVVIERVIEVLQGADGDR